MATETTVNSAEAWSPDITEVAPEDAVPDALVLSATTVAGSIEGDEPVVRVQWVDDADATEVAEGEPLAESDPDLAETVVQTVKISQLIRLSREQWLQPNASQLIADSVQRAVTVAGNASFINRPAPDPESSQRGPTGLVLTEEAQTTTVADNLDALVDLQAAVSTEGAAPTGFILSPTAWASLRKLKRQEGSAESLLGVGAEDAVPYLLDVPVTVSPAVPVGQGLLVDNTAIVSAVGQVLVATSDQAYFASDSIGVRCTWRIGWSPVHPERLGVFDVIDPASS